MVAAWRGTVVEDNNLTVQISALRRVLDQDRAGQLHPNGGRARLPLCRAGDTGRARGPGYI
jgi:hypothetical protein